MATEKQFPLIKPTSRSYSPGEYPQNEFQALNGVKTIIRYGKHRYNSTLTLGFNNISDDDAALILDNYVEVNGEWNYVTFNRGFATAGMEPSNLRGYFTETNSSGSALKWRYDGPPTVTSVYPGLSNVECKFVACLDSPQNIITV